MEADEANVSCLGWCPGKDESECDVWYSLLTDTDGFAFWYRHSLVGKHGRHRQQEFAP